MKAADLQPQRFLTRPHYSGATASPPLSDASPGRKASAEDCKNRTLPSANTMFTSPGCGGQKMEYVEFQDMR